MQMSPIPSEPIASRPIAPQETSPPPPTSADSQVIETARKTDELGVFNHPAKSSDLKGASRPTPNPSAEQIKEGSESMQNGENISDVRFAQGEIEAMINAATVETRKAVESDPALQRQSVQNNPSAPNPSLQNATDRVSVSWKDIETPNQAPSNQKADPSLLSPFKFVAKNLTKAVANLKKGAKAVRDEALKLATMDIRVGGAVRTEKSAKQTAESPIQAFFTGVLKLGPKDKQYDAKVKEFAENLKGCSVSLMKNIKPEEFGVERKDRNDKAPNLNHAIKQFDQLAAWTMGQIDQTKGKEREKLLNFFINVAQDLHANQKDFFSRDALLAGLNRYKKSDEWNKLPAEQKEKFDLLRGHAENREMMNRRIEGNPAAIPPLEYYFRPIEIGGSQGRIKVQENFQLRQGNLPQAEVKLAGLQDAIANHVIPDDAF